MGLVDHNGTGNCVGLKVWWIERWRINENSLYVCLRWLQNIPALITPHLIFTIVWEGK